MMREGIGSDFPHGKKSSGYCWIWDEGDKMRRFPRDLKYSNDGTRADWASPRAN
jgi:hypothetical protein